MTPIKMDLSQAVLLVVLLVSKVYASLLDGLEHHGHHGQHHGDLHGDHTHGHHDHGDHGHEHHPHIDHSHGNHDHGDHAHGEHTHEDEHSHDHDGNTVRSQDNSAAALAADLSGDFLNNFPATTKPNLAPAETFVAPGPLGSVKNFEVPTTTELNESFVTSARSAAEIFTSPDEEKQLQRQKQLQQTAADISTHSLKEDQSAAHALSRDAKQLANVSGGGRGTGNYPEYATVPRTSFSCAAQTTGGYFADTEAECQVFHICLNGQSLGSFLCPNGTLFHQQYFVCDWWFNVDCGVSDQSYDLNARIGVVPESQ